MGVFVTLAAGFVGVAVGFFVAVTFVVGFIVAFGGNAGAFVETDGGTVAVGMPLGSPPGVAVSPTSGVGVISGVFVAEGVAVTLISAVGDAAGVGEADGEAPLREHAVSSNIKLKKIVSFFVTSVDPLRLVYIIITCISQRMNTK